MNVTNMQRLADVLISSWILAKGPQAPLPTGQGILDRALKTAVDGGNFTGEFKKLRFVRTRLGTRCPQLGAILGWAQAANATSDPNPTYETTETRPSVAVASQILDELDIDLGDAKRWGEELAKAISAELIAEQVQLNNSQ